MPNPHDNPAALKELQDAIYRDKVLRARSMTPDQRLAEVFELSDHQLGMMHSGAMIKLGTNDINAGWEEVRRWVRRLDAVRDYRFYSSTRPEHAASPATNCP